MLDRDLAILYRVTVKTLNQGVKRNLERFPEDFMFQLTKKEAENSRSQFVTLKQGQNIKYLPYAFTEPGVAMLSSILHSHEAIEVNIQIIRAFIRMREISIAHNDLWLKIDALEKKYDGQFQVVFLAIKMILGDKSGQDPPKRF